MIRLKEDVEDANPKKNLNLDDILDLTVFDIFVLFYLMIFSGGSVRFALLQDLNAYFSHSRQNVPSSAKFRKQLSPSSFYNILKKLEKKGLTASIDKGRNVRTVEATPLAREALKMVSLFTLAASFDLTKEFAFLEEVMIKEFDIGHLKSLLFISIDSFYLVPMIKKFSELEFIETLYVLADEEILERYFDRDIKNIRISTTLNSVIREPNDFFEATFIYRYRAIEDFYGMSGKALLREAVRITKPEQPVILVSWTGKEQLDNSIVSSLIEELMDSSPFFFEISKHEVIEDMKNAGISEPKIYDLRGGFLAWGRAP
ncbi:MAG: hypothetical protein ACFFC7_05110 [Candidatus Hermodarchaeota archaeon]